MSMCRLNKSNDKTYKNNQTKKVLILSENPIKCSSLYFVSISLSILRTPPLNINEELERSNTNKWRAPYNSVLSLFSMVLIFYLKYSHVDIIYYLCEAYILSISIDNIFFQCNIVLSAKYSHFACNKMFYLLNTNHSCFI